MPRKGVAVLFVLVLMAVMAFLAANINYRLLNLVKMFESQQQYQQAYWYGISAESLALSALTLSLIKEKNVNLSQHWAQGERFFPLPDGYLQSELFDMQACFNLNVFAEKKMAPSISAQLPELRQLVRLIHGLDVSVYQAEMIAESVWEFIDEDSTVHTRLGREDSEYLGRKIPFYTQNQSFIDLSELRVVQGMDAQIYHKLRPYVCVRPQSEQQINVNTLTISQSLLLEALFTPYLTSLQAQQILKARPIHGWESVDEFLNETELAHLKPNVKKQFEKYLSVDSKYFRLRTHVQMENISLVINSIIARNSANKFDVIWHQKGELE